jgi:hypothetical protein
MKKQFIYVEARQAGDDVSFRHVPVSAADDDDAYLLGGRAMDALNAANRDDHAEGDLLNDYVIAL